MRSSQSDGWVRLAGEPRQAIRAAAVESVEAHDGGTTLRTVSGKEYRLEADIDDVMDAVEGKYTEPLARAGAEPFVFRQ